MDMEVSFGSLILPAYQDRCGPQFAGVHEVCITYRNNQEQVDFQRLLNKAKHVTVIMRAVLEN